MCVNNVTLADLHLLVLLRELYPDSSHFKLACLFRTDGHSGEEASEVTSSVQIC
jgi:hypothetical protein